MSKFAYGAKEVLCAFDVSIPHGGKNLKAFLVSTFPDVDFSTWPPDRYQEAFARMCGAQNLFTAHNEAKRDALDGHAVPLTAVEREKKLQQLQRREYLAGKPFFPGEKPEAEPAWFREMFSDEFAKKFPHRWRRMAYDHFAAEHSMMRVRTSEVTLDLVCGDGAEEIARAVFTSWGDTGCLIDFRQDSAWDDLVQFAQRPFGVLAKSVTLVGIRHQLQTGKADDFIARLSDIAKSDPRLHILLATHSKDVNFFVRAKRDGNMFETVFVNDLDQIEEQLQWWKMHKLA